MKKLQILLAVLVVNAGNANADEQIRRVQEELRARHLYYGEIDGQKTEATTRALQHYQEKKGLKVTGAPDPDTLSSLNLSASIPATEAWPDVPVLKSDAAREMREEDRKYLESLDPEPVGEGPDSNAGPPTEESVPPKSTTPPARKPAPPPPKKERVPEKEPQRPPEKESQRPPEKEPQPPPEKDTESSIPPGRAEEFVRDYLDACETNKLSDETAYYADKVKYFDNGVVDRHFIERDVAAFYKHWPERQYELLDFKVLNAGEDRATVKFRIAFHYRSPQHTVSGRTDNVFTIAKAGDQMKFTALREQRIRE